MQEKQIDCLETNYKEILYRILLVVECRYNNQNIIDSCNQLKNAVCNDDYNTAFLHFNAITGLCQICEYKMPEEKDKFVDTDILLDVAKEILSKLSKIRDNRNQS